jgi:hypothetical protein
LARACNRRIQPDDFGRGAVRMAGDLAHLADLLPHLAKAARQRKLDEIDAVGFQEVPRRSLVVLARRDDVGLEHQNVLGAARQDWKMAGAFAEPALPRVAREPAQAQDLPGIGQRQQQLIGANIHRHDARACGKRWRGRHQQRRGSDRPQQPAAAHRTSAQGTITASLWYSAR